MYSIILLFSYEFTPCESEEYVYYAVYNNKKKPSKDEFIEAYGSNGWKFVYEKDSWYYFRKKGTENFNESERNNQISKNNLYRTIRTKVAFALVFMTVFVFYTNMFPMEGGHTVILLKKVVNAVYLIGLAIFFVFATALFVITNKKLRENNNYGEEIKK